jgi:LysM repeat protein
MLILLLLGSLIVAVAARQSSGAGHQQTVIVRPGDTLWSIAVAHYAGDPREGVWKIQQRNHLASETIDPGERLVLPAD